MGNYENHFGETDGKQPEPRSKMTNALNLFIFIMLGRYLATTFSLPSIHVVKESMLDRIQLTITAYEIPRQLLLRGKIEVNAWQYATVDDSGDGSLDQEAFIRFEISSVKAAVTDTVNSHVVNAVQEFVLIPPQVPTKLKFVLRIANDNAERKPSPHCIVTGFCQDLVVLPKSDRDEIDFAMWTADAPVYESYNAQEVINHLTASFRAAMDSVSRLPAEALFSGGQSGLQFRHFLNDVGMLPHIRYLQVGVRDCSALCAILYGTEIRAVAFVAGGEQTLWEDIYRFKAFGLSSVKLFNSDYFKEIESVTTRTSIVKELEGLVNVFYFSGDGPLSALDHFMVLTNSLDLLAHTFIYIVDDWNSDAVRLSTNVAVDALELVVLFKIEVQSAGNDSQNPTPWHNGVAVFLFGKKL